MMINRRYKGKYHYSVPEGWMNDPNGCVFFNNEYHIFYQSNPKVARPEFVGWGHISTKDFLHFTKYEEALVIEKPYENFGCWSGSAIEINGKLNLVYTGNGNAIQQQCLATSSDGAKTFEKYENNPVLRSDMLPDHCDIHAWRDPYLFKEGDDVYVLTGARDTRGYGKVLTYKTKDLVNWEYVGEFTKSNMMANPGIFECPSLAKFKDGGYVFVSSVNFVRTKGNKYQNFATTLGMVGKFDPLTGKFSGKEKQELDAGFDYYAPQVLRGPDGRNILIGWMQMWERNFPTQEDGWVGSLSLPRELTLDNGKIIQYPVKEILDKETVLASYESLGSGESINMPSSCHIAMDVVLENKEGRICFFDDGMHSTSISINNGDNLIVMDRSNSGKEIVSNSPLEEQCKVRKLDYKFGEAVHLDLFLDVSSAELFVDGGKKVMTSLMYPDVQDEYKFSIHGCKLNNVLIKTI